MTKDEIEKRVSLLCEPIASSLGLEMVQIQYRYEPGGWCLRVLIDRTTGVTIEDCSSLSRELSVVLDVEEIPTNSYRLEVSSPGLDRPLTTPHDFTRFSGREARVKTLSPIQGRRNFRCILLGEQNEHVFFEVNHQRYEIPWNQIAKANLIAKC